MQGRSRFDAWSWPYAVLAIWAAWAGAVVATVAIGIAAGAYDRSKGAPGASLFPFFSWDFGWYEAIASHGYGSVVSQRYAFFPLWPWLIRASGSIPDWQWAGAIALLASGLAFLGVAAGSPAKRPRQAAVALACWPGSFALLLAYPDGLALACAAWAGALVLRRQSARGRPARRGGGDAAPDRPRDRAPARASGQRPWSVLLARRRGAGRRRGGRGGRLLDAERRRGGVLRRPEALGPLGPHGDRHVGEARLGEGLAARRARVLLLIVAVAIVVLAYRRLGLLPTVAVAYVCAVPVLLAATTSLATFVDSVRCALILPLLVVLWRLGPAYRPWAAYATLVVATLLGSGLMHSFGRQSLYAFPIFWALGEGPAWLRRPPLAAAGFVANLGIALLLTRFAP